MAPACVPSLLVATMLRVWVPGRSGFRKRKVAVGHGGKTIAGGETEVGEEGRIRHVQGEAAEATLRAEGEEIAQRRAVERYRERHVRRLRHVVVHIAAHLIDRLSQEWGFYRSVARTRVGF